MRGIAGPSPLICARCLRAKSAGVNFSPAYLVRNASNISSPPKSDGNGEQSEPRQEEKEERNAMSRRLEEMSEHAIETGGRSAAKAVEDASFSEELKRQLEEKIANASFRSDNAAAFAQVNMPASAGKGTRDIAAATPWSGTESTEDAALRMLTDAHKPLRTAPRTPTVRTARPPAKVDTGRSRKKPATGTRLANARDKASSYEHMMDSGLSEEEKEKFRQGMKMRFQAGARDVPATIQGLASLANERIEDAIARGQFKNLPRGKPIERDFNASSPFIDTTEYLMNKIIQKQEIVPPWIEKQQELVSTATRFRSGLRADWRRHVARVISSRGGGLEKQMMLAEEYAIAEAVENPPKKKEEKLNAVDEAGHMSQITLAGEMKVNTTSSADEEDAKVENEIKVMEQTFDDDGTLRPQPDETVTISTEEPAQAAEVPSPPRKPTVPPFRDEQWEQTERAYLNAAIENLNNLARSYNLMAPPIARKPYYYLDRELKACFADVAPQIAAAIRERALAPKIKGVEVSFILSIFSAVP